MRGLFGSMFSAPVAKDATYGSSGSWVPFLGGVTSAAGLRVSQASAMKVSTVFACVTIIAEDIARAEPKLYEKLPDREVKDASGKVVRMAPGGRRQVTNHWLSRLFRRPNRVQDWYQFASFMERCIGLKSNAYAVILRDNKGVPVELIPMNPDRVTVQESSEGTVFYQFSPNGLFELSIFGELQKKFSGYRIPADDVFHMHELGFNMLAGASRIGLAADAIGLAMGQEQQAGRWVGNGARPSGVLKSAKKLDEATANRLRASWQAFQGGLSNTGNTAVLEDGIEWQPMSMSAVEIEFLQSRTFQVGDICRFFRVPPHKVGELSRSTNNNIEAQDSDYTNNTLAPKFTRWERRLEFHFNLPEGMEVDFDLSDLFRMSPTSRMQNARQGVAGGILTQNEARALFDLNLTPDENGDVLLAPTNLAASGSNVSGSAPDGAGRPPASEENPT